MGKYYLNPLNFSNPKAARFLTDFGLIPTETALVNTLIIAADSTNFVGPSVAANILTAAEIVAASLGQPSTDFPTELLKIIHRALPALNGCKILASDAVSVVMDSVQDSVSTPDEMSIFSIWEEARQNLLRRLAW